MLEFLEITNGLAIKVDLTQCGRQQATVVPYSLKQKNDESALKKAGMLDYADRGSLRFIQPGSDCRCPDYSFRTRQSLYGLTQQLSLLIQNWHIVPYDTVPRCRQGTAVAAILQALLDILFRIFAACRRGLWLFACCSIESIVPSAERQL